MVFELQEKNAQVTGVFGLVVRLWCLRGVWRPLERRKRGVIQRRALRAGRADCLSLQGWFRERPDLQWTRDPYPGYEVRLVDF